jgi:hypothetical protein
VPPIDVGGGVKVRLGLEAAKVPQWSGTLLYCLTEGYTPASSGEGPTLGPVFATCSFGDEEKGKSESTWGSGKEDWPKGSYLFAHALAANRVGTYHITVTDRKGKLIAKTAFEGTKDFFHPWMPWFYLRQVEDLAKNSPAKGIALPAVDDIGPIAFVEQGKVKTGNLPTLSPTGKSPKLLIKIDKGDVVIQSEKALHAKHPQFYFLARWWVNDKPFVPQQTDTFWQSIRRGIIVYENELPMPLSFEPRLIGAKPGDKIGLQILYCESEWSWCWPQMHGHRTELNSENLRISNRLDFVAAAPKR